MGFCRRKQDPQDGTRRVTEFGETYCLIRLSILQAVITLYFTAISVSNSVGAVIAPTIALQRLLEKILVKSPNLWLICCLPVLAAPPQPRKAMVRKETVSGLSSMGTDLLPQRD